MSTNTREELIKKPPTKIRQLVQEMFELSKELEKHEKDNTLSEEQIKREYTCRGQTIAAYILTELLQIAFADFLDKAMRIYKPSDVQELKIYSEDVLKIIEYALEPSE